MGVAVFSARFRYRVTVAAVLTIMAGCAGNIADDTAADAEDPSGASIGALKKKPSPAIRRVHLCHLPKKGARQTITVPVLAVRAHLWHGDTLGRCPTRCNSVNHCDDGNACTADDCDAKGKCTHVGISCDDGDPCTIDACEKALGCTIAAADSGKCDDGNVCTGRDTCVAGVCRGTAVAGCCTQDTACTDDDACTSDRCVGGTCQNQVLDCSLDVGDACTAGFCDPLTGACSAMTVTCDDENACTEDNCDGALGCQHSSIRCDDSNECTRDACDPSTGCQHTLINGCAAEDPCPRGMLPVDGFCMDQYEATLLEIHADGSTSPWSSDQNPGATHVRAVSVAGVVPQVFISEIAASQACVAAGKRLCTDAEWLRACRGAALNTFPYGAAHITGACNDGIAQPSAALAKTGEYSECVSAEQINDLFGNLNEWTSDPSGTFRGGSYADSQVQGTGCGYATRAHDALFTDARTGFRCCADRLLP